MRIIDTIIQRQSSLGKVSALDRVESEHRRVAESAQTVVDNLASAGYHSRRAAELRAENADKNQGSIAAHEAAASRHSQAAHTQQPNDRQSAREGSVKAHVLEQDDRAMVGKLQKSIKGVTPVPQTAVDLAVVNRYVSIGMAVNKSDSVDALKQAEAILAKVTGRRGLSKQVEVRPETYQPPSPVPHPATNCGHGAVTQPSKIGGFYNAAAANAIDPALVEAVKQAGRFNPLTPANNNRSRGPFPPGTGRDDVGARG
jgi:hypothetical protein